MACSFMPAFPNGLAAMQQDANAQSDFKKRLARARK
jgi:hypothetical protein